jgi:hypothetical protein
LGFELLPEFSPSLGMTSTTANVRVIARFRPPNPREITLGFDEKNTGIVCQSPGTITINTTTNSSTDGKPEKRKFEVDRVFDQRATQVQVFEAAASQSIE